MVGKDIVARHRVLSISALLEIVAGFFQSTRLEFTPFGEDHFTLDRSRPRVFICALSALIRASSALIRTSQTAEALGSHGTRSVVGFEAVCALCALRTLLCCDVFAENGDGLVAAQKKDPKSTN